MSPSENEGIHEVGARALAQGAHIELCNYPNFSKGDPKQPLKKTFLQNIQAQYSIFLIEIYPLFLDNQGKLPRII
jgi:hypothetical protein